MANSNLIRATILTGNCDARTQRITKFTPHYMAGNMTAENCARMFANPARRASANYCIGSDGGIVLNVPESKRAWTSSSAWNDQRAVTVEVANDRADGHVTDAAWRSLVALAADVCRRNGFRLNWTGDRNGSLTAHYFYSDTSCPGPYLRARMGQLANEVNAVLDGKPSPAPAPVGLTVDGLWGGSTTARLQQVLGTVSDGVVDSQWSGWRGQNPGLTTGWQWVGSAKGSPMVRAMQKKLKVGADGLIGPNTIKALQRRMSAGLADGHLDLHSPCVKELQRRLNRGTF